MTRKTVGILCTAEESRGGAPSQRAADSYPQAVAAMTGAVPLLIPALPETQDIGHLLQVLDGVVLTGARPNVHPSEYGHAETEGHGPFDPMRDQVALELVEACVAQSVPLFGVCRGMQEMAVAFGVTLHPEIRDLPGRMNHRMDREAPREERFSPRHGVDLLPDGVFAGIYGCQQIQVNTLHGQGLLEAGERVVVEGRAPDDTAEAIVIDGAPGFAIGVQWHAETPRDSEANGPLWRAFAQAMEAR
ncbi:MAG: gamma-glutamyl-gamma-aminobutyrate hydrolase family protein [Pseudomonadota bacterium]